jgi:hypothetical protein
MARYLRLVVVLVLVAVAAILFVGLRMYRTDIKELKRFMAAYSRFDTAMAEDVLRAGHDEAGDIRRALAELEAYAGMKLSSLIKNDGELMTQAREVGALAQREYEARKGGAGEEWTSLSDKRKAAFARFLELARLSRASGIISKEE